MYGSGNQNSGFIKFREEMGFKARQTQLFFIFCYFFALFDDFSKFHRESSVWSTWKNHQIWQKMKKNLVFKTQFVKINVDVFVCNDCDFILLKKECQLLLHTIFFCLPISSHIFINSQFFGFPVGFLHNFSFQMIFICDDITIPFGDGLFFTYPNLIGNLKKIFFSVKNSSYILSKIPNYWNTAGQKILKSPGKKTRDIK